MHPPALQHWFGYHHWATDLLLHAALSLSGEELQRELGGPFASIHGLLLHLLGAEQLWAERWQGAATAGWPERYAPGARPELLAGWEEIKAAQVALLAAAEERGDGRLAYRNLRGEPNAYTLSDVAAHLVNHGTYHRGQLSHMLRQLGRTPPSTDYLRYLDHLAG